MTNTVGQLYLLSHSFHKGWMKVGRTTQDVKTRLSSSQCGSPFNDLTLVYSSCRIYNLEYCERSLIQFLESHPDVIQSKQEWFKYKRPSRFGNHGQLTRLVRTFVRTLENEYFDDNIP